MILATAAVMLGLTVKQNKALLAMPTYTEQRSAFVINRAKQVGQVDTLVLGNSLIEETVFGMDCGTLFNAGIGGSRVQDLIKYSPQLVEVNRPKRILVSIGTNHFIGTNEIDDFRRLYPKLIDSLEGHDLVLIGVTNSGEATETVKAEAAARGAIYIDPVTDDYREDGVHYTAAGAQKFRKKLVAACQSLNDERAAAAPLFGAG